MFTVSPIFVFGKKANTERKVIKILDKVEKDSRKKELLVNCEKTEYTIISHTNNSDIRETYVKRQNGKETNGLISLSLKRYNRRWKLLP